MEIVSDANAKATAEIVEYWKSSRKLETKKLKLEEASNSANNEMKVTFMPSEESDKYRKEGVAYLSQ